jgi:cytochrome P450
MAPAFDPRSIAGYAPIMTEVTQALLAKWDALAKPREADVAAAMMHTTLHIISRAMFSSDSDEIVDVVEADVNLYQSKVRPTLADFLHLPQWLARLIRSLYNRAVGYNYDAVKVFMPTEDLRGGRRNVLCTPTQ